MLNKIGKEIDLLRNYPKSKRDLSKRLEHKTPEQQKIARSFGKEFFDGDRSHGYGGYYYNEKFWSKVVLDFIEYYNLKDGNRILDIGCGKGFMLYDFKKANSKLEIVGIDISKYAIDNSKEEIKKYLKVGDAKKLNFSDKSFDLVISITTIHNLDLQECKNSLKEIERVSKKNKFITVDAFSDDKEQEQMYAWNLTAKTILHTDDWKKLFLEVGYTGDYYWFKP